jgi:mono/diheme cytochrome c family protein
MLKPFLLLSAAILLVIAIPPSLTLAAGHAPAAAPTIPIRPTSGSQERAKKIYAIDCAMCHGDNGNGKTDLATSMQLTLLDYTDPKSLAGKSDQELFNLIRNGKGQMPPEDPARAKDDEIWNLVIYIRGMSKGQPSPPPPSN